MFEIQEIASSSNILHFVCAVRLFFQNPQPITLRPGFSMILEDCRITEIEIVNILDCKWLQRAAFLYDCKGLQQDWVDVNYSCTSFNVQLYGTSVL